MALQIEGGQTPLVDADLRAIVFMAADDRVTVVNGLTGSRTEVPLGRGGYAAARTGALSGGVAPGGARFAIASSSRDDRVAVIDVGGGSVSLLAEANTSPSLPPDRGDVATEKRNPRTERLHTLAVAECIEVIQREDHAVLAALEAARPSLVSLLEDAEPRFCRGGRVVYLGAGTSGRLGVLDASEAPPTFQVAPGRIALTRMPLSFNSSRNTFEKPSKANLEMLYEPPLG